jgi:molybdopterin synthase catalytic subunit/molybdopterin converting factor small subunit
MTTVTIRYHGGTHELRGTRSERVVLTAEAPCVQDVCAHIERLVPVFTKVLPRCRIARNEEMVALSDAVHDGDQIDILPPVAGGSDDPVRLASVRDAELSLDECHRAVAHAGAGGIVIDHADGKSIEKLEYEAHGTLAEKELRRVLDVVAAEHPGTRLAVTHRVGTLAVGEVAIVLAASAAHRAEAFAACRTALDRLKESVPIWKKEWTTEGSAHWVNFGGG